MLKLSFLIGGFSYTIFLLGILGLLFKQVVILVAFIYFLIAIYFFVKNKGKTVKLSKISNLSKFFIFLILIQASVNFIGVLGPELSFDALWYHLTLPKLFLENHKVFHIGGGILYYSDLPKNIEMLYVFALSLGNEITAKFIHFLFGIGSVFALYKLSRRFLNQNLSLLSALVFYTSLVVGWQSITAYVDLGTAFFSILSITEFLNWVDKKNKKHLLFSSVLTGLAISTKITSLLSLPVFILLIILVNKNKKKNFKKTFKNIFYFVFVSCLVSLPWFLFSYFNTGNPFFPLFDKSFSFSYNINPLNIFKQVIFPSDPINPIYLITLPLLLVFYKKFDQNIKYLVVYSFLFLLSWFFTAPIGGSRLILPYLPEFSLLTVVSIFYIRNSLIKRYLITLIIIIAISSIFYRYFANEKYLPVILGVETKSQFLTKNLNFSYGDFYDTDSYFKENIKSNDIVLTFGFHNFYYIDFPFVDSSFVKKGDRFNFIATQNTTLSKRFSNFKEIHYNAKTGVKVYSSGGKMWEY